MATSSATRVSKSVKGHFGKLRAIEVHGGIQIPFRKTFQSSGLIINAKFSSGVVLRADCEPRRHLFASSPTPSVRSDRGAGTRASTDRAASVTDIQKKVPGFHVLADEQTTETGPEICQEKAKEADQTRRWIEEIREMFRYMSDGEISTSPYDTAWVALVPALDGSDRPQFPKCLDWIVDNQFLDGSWGDRNYFSYYDRICNTLACIISLETWKTGSGAVEKGVKFIHTNLQAMETDVDAHMLIGFEIVFPALIKHAKCVHLDLPYDASVISKICAEKEKKLQLIPMDIVHKVPTTLLHSLEGIHQEVNWEELLKLQSEDGSFLQSPAATAACLLHTRDEKALGYLTRLLDRFNNAVPNVYPVDLFERMWIVDRLERLGIDRHFEKEIQDALHYVYQHFTSFGIGWARGSAVQDLDDTSMGFRLLRQHGYNVSDDVFRQFEGCKEKVSEFFCFAGQSCQAVTGLFNFYRAAQTRFTGETLLETGEQFCRGFLAERLQKNECFDKWIITKDLPGEVEYALTTPWYCSLPRLETEAYLSHYGSNDIWIGKSLYRLPFVNNETFLALAKADFNHCQAMHLQDLQTITRWDEACGFGKLTFARQRCVEGVFSAACILPSPEHSPARLVWAKNCVLTTMVDDFFDVGGSLPDLHRFVAATREKVAERFKDCKALICNLRRWDPSLMDGTAQETQIVFNGLYNTLNAITEEGTLAQGRDIGQHLRNIWLRFLESVLTEAEWRASAYRPSFDEYLNIALPSVAAEPIVLCTAFFLGEPISDDLINDSKKLHLMDLGNRVGRLVNDIQGWKRENSEGKPNAVSILMREKSDSTVEEVVSNIRAMAGDSMLELVREVHQQSHIPKSFRQLHFNMARIMHLFYQKTDGYTDRTAMAKKVQQILFEPVL